MLLLGVIYIITWEREREKKKRNKWRKYNVTFHSFAAIFVTQLAQSRIYTYTRNIYIAEGKLISKGERGAFNRALHATLRARGNAAHETHSARKLAAALQPHTHTHHTRAGWNFIFIASASRGLLITPNEPSQFKREIERRRGRSCDLLTPRSSHAEIPLAPLRTSRPRRVYDGTQGRLK